MTQELRKALAAAFLMVVSALAAWWMVPTNKLVDELGRLDLETAIPKEFGDWVMDTRSFTGVVNPQQAQVLERLYSQTLSRTYINRRTGEAVMLSLAYGEDQREGMQVHYPDVCYPAQGFQISSKRNDTLRLANGEIPVRRLETYAGRRYEPVTYWAMVGEISTLGGTQQKLSELSYSLKGLIPDGMLFRVSSITPDTPAAFKLQDAFIAALLPQIPEKVRARFSGIN